MRKNQKIQIKNVLNNASLTFKLIEWDETDKKLKLKENIKQEIEHSKNINKKPKHEKFILEKIN